MKDNRNYHSRDNSSQFLTNNIHNTCQTNNNIYQSFYLVNNQNDLNNKKVKEGRIHHTKSMNLLNVDFNNENIKSLLNSNTPNYSNNISLHSENKNISNNFDKNISKN